MTIRLIADIGATNSRWLITENGFSRRLDLDGYNAVTHPREIWCTILKKIDIDPSSPLEAFLYGAGFYENKYDDIVADFKLVFPAAHKIFLDKDLLGACHGMAKDQEGIVIIMGTGSNTCYYDGKTIVENLEALGFILGGEGDAASIGIEILRNHIRNKIPADLANAFNEKYGLSHLELILQAYQPQANQFLGQFAKFASEHITHPYMNDLVTECLDRIFILMTDYGRPAVTRYFTGSIAVHFEPIIKKLCQRHGLKSYMIKPDYLDGIAAYHDAGLGK